MTWWDDPELSPAKRAIFTMVLARLKELYPQYNLDDPGVAAECADRAKRWDRQIATLAAMAMQDDPPFPDPEIRAWEN